MRRLLTFAAVALMSTTLLAQGARSGAQGARGAAPAPAADKALATIQGAWVVNSINDRPQAAMSMVFKGDKYEQVVQGTVNERGTIKIDSSTKPIAIDLIVQEGQDAGKRQLGLVEVTGENMKLKLATAGATTRPTAFRAERGSPLVLLTRQKPS